MCNIPINGKAFKKKYGQLYASKDGENLLRKTPHVHVHTRARAHTHTPDTVIRNPVNLKRKCSQAFHLHLKTYYWKSA